MGEWRYRPADAYRRSQRQTLLPDKAPLPHPRHTSSHTKTYRQTHADRLCPGKRTRSPTHRREQTTDVHTPAAKALTALFNTQACPNPTGGLFGLHQARGSRTGSGLQTGEPAAPMTCAQGGDNSDSLGQLLPPRPGKAWGAGWGGDSSSHAGTPFGHGSDRHGRHTAGTSSSPTPRRIEPNSLTSTHDTSAFAESGPPPGTARPPLLTGAWTGQDAGLRGKTTPGASALGG